MIWSILRPLQTFPYSLALLTLVTAADLWAQAARQVPSIDERRTTILGGNLHPLAVREADRGPVDPLLRLPYVTLLFRANAQQIAEREKLRAAQQTASSPDYHRWLSPEEYADRFGLDPGSLSVIRQWLENHGLKVEMTARSRTWIAFSGAAGAVESALGARLHYYDVDGTRHYAPANELSIPEAVARVTLGVRGLDDFHARPSYAGGNGNNYLAPDDLAIIYDIAPLYAAGIDGSGEKIAIVGEAQVNLDDLHMYRNAFGLAPQDPQFIAVPTSVAVGQTGDAHQREASADLEIAGAVARKASLVYIYGISVEDAIRLAIDTAAAPVLSSSYIVCEKDTTDTFRSDILTRAEEAEMKGITWVNASGDSGPAACDRQSVAGSVAVRGLAVNFLAAPSEVTAVGGTRFNENGSQSFWGGGNSPTLGSALSYIPETVWNDSGPGGLDASGGGVSQVVQQPSWQVYPTNGMRGIPDVSLSASGHDAYLFCNQGNCPGTSLGTFGGTSAGAPAFAGMVALLGQYLKAPGGLGTINQKLYELAQLSKSAFHDVVSGDNKVSCQNATPDCTDGTYGYAAGPGYDLATGLGSVDVTALAGAWAGTGLIPSTTMVTGGFKTTFNPTDAADLSVTVTCGTTPPTGRVSFTAGAQVIGSAPLSPGTGQSTATITVLSTQLTVGPNTVTAWFSGNANCAPSLATTSASLVNTARGSNVTMFISPNPVPEKNQGWMPTINLRESGGGAATLTHLYLNGMDYTAQLGNFGSSQISAFGTLSGTFTLSTGITAPMPVPVELDGTDSNGPWVRKTSVIITGYAGQAAMQLTGIPQAVLKNATSSSCPWNLKLVLNETAGVAVTLTSFVTPFQDLSNDVLKYWNSPCSTTTPTTSPVPACLAANGKLTATVCFNGLDNYVPTLMDFVVGGMDSHGNHVNATITVPYLPAATAPNTLAAAPASLTATGAPQLLTVTASATSQVWTMAFASGSKPAWLNLSQLSGTGSGTLVVSATAGTLDPGTYSETMYVQSLDATPQFVEIPVTFTVN